MCRAAWETSGRMRKRSNTEQKWCGSEWEWLYYVNTGLDCSLETSKRTSKLTENVQMTYRKEE